MKSCFSALQGAGLWSAQPQLWSAAPPFVCARPLMFTGEEEEEDRASAGMEAGGEEGAGLELFNAEQYYRDSVFFFCSAARQTQLSVGL